MKLAVAAVIAVAAVVTINLWDRSLPTAYAFEQTLEASHGVRYLQIRSFRPGMEEAKKHWVELDDAGQVKNLRVEIPAWEAPSEGARIAVWQHGKAKIWFKQKRVLVTVPEQRVADLILKMVQVVDPQLALQRFSDFEKRGLVTLEIQEPADKSQPITVTCTNSPQQGNVGSQSERTVLSIDQATKLVLKMERYRLAPDGGAELLGWIEFAGYNQPIDPAVFTLDDVPEDVVRADQTTPEVGVEQGGLSDKEIAVKVVREFYEAVIAQDYAKAGRLCGGAPAAAIEGLFRDLKVVRIVSLGEPQPPADPGVGGLVVPCQLEIEKDGVKSIYTPAGPGVRPLYNLPSRWGIHGGVTQD